MPAKKPPQQVQPQQQVIDKKEEPVTKKVNTVSKKEVKKVVKSDEQPPSVTMQTPVSEVEVVVNKIEDNNNVTKDDSGNGDILINSLLEKVSNVSTQIKSIQTGLKLLVKEFDKQRKVIERVQKKRDKAKKSPSGFAKPCKISDQLCNFIGVPIGSEKSRTDITRYINSYVKEHNLNNPENKREFFPDNKLKSILKYNDGEKVTYFVLQRMIAHHFPPSMSKLAAAAAASYSAK